MRSTASFGVLNSTVAVVFDPNIIANAVSSRTFAARIIHTLLMKKAMHDSDNATPAATVVNKLSFVLIVLCE